MKRLLLTISLVLMTLILSAQKKSNYEKYWQAKEDSLNKTTATAKPEYDDLYYQPSKDAKKIKKQKRTDVDQVVDTLIKYNPEIKVTYEYNYDPFFYSYNLGRFYHGGFNYWMYSNPWYYSNWMYDPYDFYWDMRFSGYPYWTYPYYNQFYFGYNYWNPWRFNYGWGHNWYGNNHNWYSNNNNWNGGHGNFNQRPEYGRRERSSALSSNYNNNVERRVAPQSKPAYQQQNRRTYTPSYDSPRLSTRPQYNNSKVGDVTNRRANVNTQTRTQSSTFNRTPNTQMRTESRTQSRTYTAPTRSYNETRSYNNNGGDRRSSGSYGGSSNFSSGSNYSAPRSSGSSNFSSGSSSSGSSGGRSSGSSSSSGRR
jgi:hypothetical protein